MSAKSSLKERLVRREDARGNPRVPSISPTDSLPTHSLLLKGEKIASPVEVALTLRNLGLSLRRSHETLNRLADGNLTAISLRTKRDSRTVIAQLAAMGVKAALIVRPETNAKAVRKVFGISQPEFATRFGLELDSVRNWEQLRYKMDPAARLLLKIIEKYPDVVQEILTGGKMQNEDSLSHTKAR
jgi:DNA-binding transcriptional regulator YiaG